ncbi:MAG: KH domain-containing protein [Bacilli bacterium]|nr:KH domain-containing protein [Bacilli bacterium]
MKYEVFNGKNLEELKKEALESLNLDEKDCLISVTSTKSGLFKTKEEFEIKVYKLVDIAEEIKNYLNELLTNMNINANFETKIRDEQISIKMFSDNNKILIGRDGKTLKALQTVIRQHIFREVGSYPYVLLDVENYKEKKMKNLEFLTKKLAKEVLRTKQPIAMDNMNSYERRIAHNVLSTFDGLTSASEGEEPNRHIVIKIKEN